jgi:monothiol glutaredoxin
MCGFSARAAQALQGCGQPFAYVNVLANPEVFENLPRFANWPTFPQIYIDGELVGGCDITLELYQKGELQEMVKAAVAKAQPAA